MDIIEIRFKNFQTLIAIFKKKLADQGDPERGHVARFGKFVGVSPAYISHVINGRKHIGHDLARKLEKSFGYPSGWMDHDHLTLGNPTNRAEKEFVELALKMFRDDPTNAQAAMMRYMVSKIDALSDKRTD